MLDRGTASFTLATTAVALMLLAIPLTLVSVGPYWALAAGPGIAALLSAGVWIALHRVCKGAGGRGAHAAALAGIALLCAWAVLGVSFGGFTAVPAALALMVAHALVPARR